MVALVASVGLRAFALIASPGNLDLVVVLLQGSSSYAHSKRRYSFFCPKSLAQVFVARVAEDRDNRVFFPQVKLLGDFQTADDPSRG